MKGLRVSVDEKKQTITVEMPITVPPTPSKTGNTLLVATTRGAAETDVVVNGQPLYLNLNAYVYPGPKPGKGGKGKQEE